MSRWKASAIDVSFGFPGMSLSGTWQPDEAERQAAWELLVELSTRVTIAGIDDDEGLMSEALASLHDLFATTRGILRTHGPVVARSGGSGNLSFGVIAVRVLNDVLRPILNEWHPRLTAHEQERPPSVSAVEWEREFLPQPPAATRQGTTRAGRDHFDLRPADTREPGPAALRKDRPVAPAPTGRPEQLPLLGTRPGCQPPAHLLTGATIASSATTAQWSLTGRRYPGADVEGRVRPAHDAEVRQCHGQQRRDHE